MDAVQALPGKRRSVVISGAGDRRDEDLRRQTEILGDAFDEVILYQDAAQRGRADGEVIALLRDGLRAARWPVDPLPTARQALADLDQQMVETGAELGLLVHRHLEPRGLAEAAH